MRSDARRNYERLLAEAHAAVIESGTGASLEEIARRAGVGIGTLYRHFPTRHALLEALLRERFEELRGVADELLDTDDPTTAVAEGLRRFAIHATTYHGLTELMASALRDESSELYTACHAMQESADALLKRAQRAKLIRADVDASDLYGLAYGMAFVAEHDPEPERRIDRLVALLLDGLRPRTDRARARR